MLKKKNDARFKELGSNTLRERLFEDFMLEKVLT
jgi:hypothetical protein